LPFPPLDFAFPSSLIGRSSSWSDGRPPEATMQHPPIAARRPVSLAPRLKGVRLLVDNAGAPQVDGAVPVMMAVKVSPQASLPGGLSSGASSALVREADGRTVRIKRCGFATRGIGGPVGHVGRIGLMGIAEALQESRMLALFRAQGLATACKPEALDILADPSAPFFEENAYAMVRIAVTSDVRADEWLLRLVTEELAAIGRGDVRMSVAGGERVGLEASGKPVGLEIKGRLLERTESLGRGLGGLMRATHDAGLLRGRGSVWMGNDVVGPDLRLSAIDADGGARSIGEGSLANLRRIEVAEYAAGFADCYSWGQPDWLAELATVLFETFLDGYRAAADFKVG